MPDKTEVIRDLARILRLEDRHIELIAREITHGAEVDPGQEVERFLVKAVIAENRLIGKAG